MGYFAYQVHDFAHQLHSLAPAGHAYSSIYYTLLGADHAHVAIGILFSVWLLWKLGSGLTTYRRRAIAAHRLLPHAVNLLTLVVIGVPERRARRYEPAATCDGSPSCSGSPSSSTGGRGATPAHRRLLRRCRPRCGVAGESLGHRGHDVGALNPGLRFLPRARLGGTAESRSSARRARRNYGDGPPGDGRWSGALPQTRIHFFATAAMVANVLFLAILLMSGLASGLENACVQS